MVPELDHAVAEHAEGAQGSLGRLVVTGPHVLQPVGNAVPVGVAARHLVDVAHAQQVLALVAHVAELEGGALPELLLPGDVPLQVVRILPAVQGPPHGGSAEAGAEQPAHGSLALSSVRMPLSRLLKGGFWKASESEGPRRSRVKKRPRPARRAVWPLPNTSQATPRRGAMSPVALS